jgi:hypothetical protein
MTDRYGRELVPVDSRRGLVLVFPPASTAGSVSSAWSVLTRVGPDGRSESRSSDSWGAWDPSQNILRVRFGADDERGPATVREIFTSWPRGITSRMLREVPLERLENAVNRHGTMQELMPRFLGISRLGVWSDEPLVEGQSWWLLPVHEDDIQWVDLSRGYWLEVPRGYGRPDSFYAEVAELYGRAVLASDRPANEIAEANEVPVTTVHGWIKEARRRGHLPPGTNNRRAAE